MPLLLPTTSYAHYSPEVSTERLINAFAEKQGQGARSPWIVTGTPGIREWAEVGTGPIRGMIEMNGVPYVVSGQDLWTIAEDGTPTIKGSGIAGSAVVGAEQNGFEIVIVNGLNVFSYLLADDTLVQVASAGAFAADTVTLLNQTFILNKNGTNQFFISSILDGRDYPILDFASAETNPDFLLAVKAYNGLLYLFGQETIELWNYTGGALFPFASISGAGIARGLGAPKGFAVEDSGIFILGDDMVAYRIGGQQAVRISNHALESLWESFAVKEDAYCFTLPIRGHKFVYYTFPTANRTFGFDIASGRWHERSSYNFTSVVNKWRATGAISAYGKTLVGDTDSNKVGILDPNVFTEFGDPLIFDVTTPNYYENGENIGFKRLSTDFQTGVGLNSGQGSQPVVMMRYSHSAGRSWSPEINASLGIIGETRARANWDGLGTADQWAFNFRISDPVARVMTGVHKDRPR